MPPKKNPSLEELVAALSDKLDTLTTSQNERFDNIDKSLEEIKTENQQLKKDVTTLQEENSFLKQKLQNLEQHSRSTNIRVLNLEIEGITDNYDSLVDQVYEKVLQPILTGAVTEGRLKTLPPRERLITSAHFLPGKDNKPKPIIVRLQNGVYRSIILQSQRKYGVRSDQPQHRSATRSTQPPRDAARPAPLLHPVFEDSTAEMYRFKQMLAGRDDVAAAWIAGGSIRYKLVDSEVVKKVRSIYDPIESIISQ